MSITPEQLEHETYPQLPLLQELQAIYGGDIAVAEGEVGDGTLALNSEAYIFAMKRDGEIHVTQKETEEVFFIGDPTLSDVEGLLISMDE